MRFAIAQQTAERLRWPLHPIQDCGHGPHIELPEEFTDTLRRLSRPERHDPLSDRERTSHALR
jgi:pimeloyl-ACP methyl ester carboxylesterase